MKIALLAPSTVGKTAYLTGLYGVLTQDLSYTRYGIDFAVADFIMDSSLSDRYDNLVNEGDFGKSSEGIIAYPWNLSTSAEDGGKKRLGIEIVDFPGEVLHKKLDSLENNQKKEEIIQGLSDCDGFIVLLDGEALTKNVDQNNPRRLQNTLKTNHVSSVLESALERRRTRLLGQMVDPNAYAFSAGPTPIVFALTKSDLVTNWISQPNKAESLNNTVQDLYGRNAAAGIKQSADEGEIANFIRSQFGRIIDTPDVVSARLGVSVYNQALGRVEPVNLEFAFQLVLFTGLLNAFTEYKRRVTDWSNDLQEKDREYESATESYQSAASAKDSFYKKGLIDQLWDNCFETKDAWWHDRAAASAYQKHLNSVEKYNKTLALLAQAKENQETAKLFGQRILSDELVYRLEHCNQKQRFYTDGLPIKLLSEFDWWQRKSEAGRAVFQRENKPEAGL